jgi:phenylacetate-CoA ligase
VPVTVELAPGRRDDGGHATAIRERLRGVLVVQMDVELVPWGTLQRSEYKSRLIER